MKIYSLVRLNLKNDLTDLADDFSLVFVILSGQGLCNTILGKSTGKVGNLDGKTTTLTPSVQRKYKLNNNIYLFIVRLLLVMNYVLNIILDLYIIFGQDHIKT